VSKQNIKTFLIDEFFTFATGVNDTVGAPCAANISANFRKNQNVINGILRDLGETDL
jgi:hypothetical protein